MGLGSKAVSESQKTRAALSVPSTMDHSGPLRNYAVIGALSAVIFGVLAAQRAAQAAADKVPLGIHKS